jgi:hypothetical protein
MDNNVRLISSSIVIIGCLYIQVVSSIKSSHGTNTKKVAIVQHTILSYALGSQVEMGSMYNIFGNATFEFDWTYSERISSELSL